MPSSFGNALRVSIFGQSHSAAIGCVVEGLPSGIEVDMEALQAFMARRAPGQAPWSTPRKEKDVPRIASGLNPEGRTCGAPLAIVIGNTNTRSQDYANVLETPRPGHADYPAFAKWRGNQDVPGGGHFSGRLTAPLCAAGGIALQVLGQRDIRVAAHLLEVAGIRDEGLDALDTSLPAQRHLEAQMGALATPRPFPTLDEAAGSEMIAAIAAAHDQDDSVGGIVECVATGMPCGVGSPMFDGIENLIARAAFGIPAVKGIEFGRGFEVARLRGSENNDPYGLRDGAVFPSTNNAGGALGGLSTGAPVLFRLAIKPTPSIALPQQSVNLGDMNPQELAIRGRHDPCIAPRAVPVAEAVCALALLDALLSFPAEEPWA